MQGPAARQQLYDLRAMDFLIQQVSLEAELHMVVSLPVSSTPTTAPIETSGLHSAAAQPTSCPFRTPGLLQSSRQATAPGVPQATVGSLGPQPPKASYRSPSSRLRLPALAPGSARSPRISARYLGLQANGDAFKGAELPPLDRVTMPAGFVSTGDLEEDTQQLLEMDSEVHVALHCWLRGLLLTASAADMVSTLLCPTTGFV